MNIATPLVCNMGVFTPDERESHLHNTAELIQAVQRAQEVENGYELQFPNETALISKIAEFISKERLCCPFLRFTLTVDSENESVTLLLTGPIGTQEFLRAEFNGAIQ